MKYRGQIEPRYWNIFTYKLSDTSTFGYEQRLRDVQGNRVTVRLKKHNVIPIIIVPYAGTKNIEVRLGKEMRKANFAEYVLMRGGIVLFTDEFEQCLQTKLGRHVDFMRTFKAWWTQKKTDKPDSAHEQEFTRLLLDYLFGQGSK
jgi:hypothetical protein